MQALKTSFENSGTQQRQGIDAQQEEISRLTQEVEKLKHAILILERTTCDGILLWKMDDFSRRRQEAMDGVTLSLYPTPFYTSRHGYKMCAHVYLNGDGLGKGTHLSFFFVIMRGPFDALLVWPFKQKVTLTLINQAGKKHVTDSFRPDPHSSSFQRPGRKKKEHCIRSSSVPSSQTSSEWRVH